jgi:hypothetical protein
MVLLERFGGHTLPHYTYSCMHSILAMCLVHCCSYDLPHFLITYPTCYRLNFFYQLYHILWLAICPPHFCGCHNLPNVSCGKMWPTTKYTRSFDLGGRQECSSKESTPSVQKKKTNPEYKSVHASCLVVCPESYLKFVFFF